MTPFGIAGRAIGPGHPCFVIAEAGVNHNGDVQLAIDLVHAAKDAGADAVKFQTFKAESLVTESGRKALYQREYATDLSSQRSLLQKLELPFEAFARLKREAERLGLVFLSTPFDEESARYLRSLNVAAYKIGSGDLTNLPLLEVVAGFRKPVILSTGMATINDVHDAADVLEAAGLGGTSLALLHCVSCYPAPADQTNLLAMDAMRAAFEVPIGLSDHSTGTTIAIAAAALGANIIEKHLTLDPLMDGPDHASSLESLEFASMVRGIRRVEQALGDGIKRVMPCETDLVVAARRSWVATRVLEPGMRLVADDLVLKRPGNGLTARDIAGLIGRRLHKGLKIDEQITWDHLEKEPR